MSMKQMVVVKSSCEAEYMASAAATQATWLRRLLEKMTGVTVPKPTIKMDNMAAIALAKNPILHDHSKHSDVMFHYTRECVERGDVDVEQVDTNELRKKISIIKVSTIKKQK
jgi:hypothetical protein